MRKFQILIIFLLLFISSCSSGKKQIVIAFLDRPVTLAPNKVREIKVSGILSNFYNSLVEYDPFMKIKPSLAYAWTNTDDTTWIFYLRKNVYFHDGAPFTAEDVEYTIKKIEEMPHSDVKNYVSNISSIKVMGDHKIKIVTKVTDTNLLGKLAAIFIESKTTVDQSSLNGTGPLIPKMISPNEIVATPFKRYWGKKIKCHTVVIKFYDNFKDAMKDYKAGRIDLLAETNYFMLDSFKDYKSNTIIGIEAALRYIGLNLKMYPLNNRDFRKGLSFAINREKMVEYVYKGLASPATQYAIPFVKGFDPNRSSRLYNPDSAVYYFKKSKVKFPVKIEITASPRRIDMIKFLSDQLEKYGIKVIVDTLPAKDLFGKINRGDFNAYLLGSIPDLPDISNVLNDLFYTKEKCGGNHNRMGYSNRKVDSILDVLNRQSNLTERESLGWKAQSIILNDMPIIPLVYEKNYYLTSDKIEYTPRSDNYVTIKEIKIK